MSSNPLDAEAQEVFPLVATILRKAQHRIDAETGEPIEIGDEVVHLKEMLLSAYEKLDRTCRWTQENKDSYWTSECNVWFELEDEPRECGFNFCPECGARVEA